MSRALRFLTSLMLILACAASFPALADTVPATNPLSATQARAFRAWFVRLVTEQLRQGPTPRWQQRDCAGLVRFAVAESLRDHDARWLQQNGIGLTNLPPEVDLPPAQRDTLRQQWINANQKRSAYAPAFAVIEHNSQLVSRDINQAQPGDLLFFDQGDDQHLMVWTGRYVAYHTGTVTTKDNGMRAVSVDQLMHWPDSRWWPAQTNPNFVGVFRLAFLPG
jgi:uncharacterized protein YfaT (DUF1175 family)